MRLEIDGVAGQEGAVADSAAKSAGSDLLCYQRHLSEGLIARQNAAWDPVLQWFSGAHGLKFQAIAGIIHVAQPETSLKRVRELLGHFNAFELATAPSDDDAHGVGVLGDRAC